MGEWGERRSSSPMAWLEGRGRQGHQDERETERERERERVSERCTYVGGGLVSVPKRPEPNWHALFRRRGRDKGKEIEIRATEERLRG